LGKKRRNNGQVGMNRDTGYHPEYDAAGGHGIAAASGHFDGYDITDVPLGDLMRGERATLGKSLLDVERELKIRAAFIAAIENGDVGAFSSPGFIAGYIRSYARYLKIDPEWAFRRFCDETGFQGVHGFSAVRQAEQVKRSFGDAPRRVDPNEVFTSARVSFAPGRDSMFSGIEPGALGSIAVLIALVLGLGYGAWAVLHDIQRLSIAPVDEAPVPLAQLDPLAGAHQGAFDVVQEFDVAMPGPEGIERLARPQPLDTPRLTPRDQALAALDPNEVGALPDVAPISRAAVPTLAPAMPRTAQAAEAEVAAPIETASAVQVTQPVQQDEIVLFAVRPTWIRITSPSGATIREATLNRGDTITIPTEGDAPLLRTGNAGALYAGVNGVVFGPFGEGAVIVSDLSLDADTLTGRYAMADPSGDADLAEVAALALTE
jgi:cytoskeletal protein RodZ